MTHTDGVREVSVTGNMVLVVLSPVAPTRDSEGKVVSFTVFLTSGGDAVCRSPEGRDPKTMRCPFPISITMSISGAAPIDSVPSWEATRRQVPPETRALTV